MPEPETAPAGTPGRLARSISRFVDRLPAPMRRYGQQIGGWQRIQLAFKTALACGIAWIIARQLPGEVADYPYYAPLGALISMYSTVADSVKTSLQTLAGLLLGIGLAWLLLLTVGLHVLTVSLLVFLGVLVAGLPRLGAGRDWVPMAALFVLLVGGSDAGDYSLGYAVQMAVGVLVGITVNFLLIPPLNFSAVGRSLQQLQSDLAGQLEEIAEALLEDWPPERDEWASNGENIVRLSEQVRQAVATADRSRKANPRRRFQDRDLQADWSNLRTLERAAFNTQDITEVLGAVIWDDHLHIPTRVLEPMSEALKATAAAVRSLAAEDLQEKLDAASAAQQQLTTELAGSVTTETPGTAGGYVAVSLDRILSALRRQLDDSTNQQR
ncbi:FUSC family protein [Arthrobacter sp. CAU 1506]|uniref:FUSC family protein n=1 Tax=Arthrobacter sp. CAU 1506 TaxID=2560052 RepID=UPI0010AD9B88|nr:aromatic acid exporter family protein [Arthrobacter sp. CAU 1506]TJY68887.1 FUSC family protein [Arthrobacter sp. CAU 1506]